MTMIIKMTTEGEIAALPIIYLRRVFMTLRAVLSEVFDEAAYSRFLIRTRRPSSREAYAQFTSERETGTARRPRCC